MAVRKQKLGHRMARPGRSSGPAVLCVAGADLLRGQVFQQDREGLHTCVMLTIFNADVNFQHPWLKKPGWTS